MDLEPIFFKIFQYKLNTYCITKKPYLSFNFGINHLIQDTKLFFNTHFCQNHESSLWNQQYQVTASNQKYPTSSLKLIPFNYMEFDLYNDKYFVSLSPKMYSVYSKFIQDVAIRYGISYIRDTLPSLVGSFNIEDIVLLSARFSDKNFSLFYKLNFDLLSFFFFGLKLNNCGSFWDSLTDIHLGWQVPISNKIYLFGFGISEPLELSISTRKKNSRFTYIYRNAYSDTARKYKNYNFIQYKYLYRGSKLGAMYDFSHNNLMVRGSLRLSNHFKFKLSTEYDGDWHNPAFGLSFNFGTV